MVGPAAPRAGCGVRRRRPSWRRARGAGSAASRPPTSRRHGHEQAVGRVDGDAEMDLPVQQPAVGLGPRKCAFSAGSARQPATIARTRRIVTSSASAQPPMSASSVTVAGTTSACARAMLLRHGAAHRRAAARPAPAALSPRRGLDIGRRDRALRARSARTLPRSTPSSLRAGRAPPAPLGPQGHAAPAWPAHPRPVPLGISPTTVPVSAAAASANSTSGAPVLTMSPGCPCRLAMTARHAARGSRPRPCRSRPRPEAGRR